MVAVNFSGWWTGKKSREEQKAYVFDKIRSRIKDQTIRKVGKRVIKVEEPLQLYWGMRQKWCEKISDAICTRVLKVAFDVDGPVIIYDSDGWIAPGFRLHGKDLEDFATRDGFESVESFLKAFELGVYNVYRWEVI